MALTRKQIIAQVGEELGLVLPGTATSGSTTTIIDTSADSPMDPGDVADRLNGAGIFFDDTTNLQYRNNIVYTPSSQTITWSGVTGVTGSGKEYEIHLEPILSRLRIWPLLIDKALRLIRRLTTPHILLNNRGYFDLTRFADIVGVEQVRRLYWLGPNLLDNADFEEWPTGQAAPSNWTASAAVTRGVIQNYPHSVTMVNGRTMYQDINVGVQSRRIQVSAWCTPPANPNSFDLTLEAYLSDGSTVERTTSASIAFSATDTGDRELLAAIETTSRTAFVRVTFTASGGTGTVWAPVAYHLSRGQRRRLLPVNVLDAHEPEDNVGLQTRTLRMYIAERLGRDVGQFLLLLPYTALGSTATSAADATSTAAPDDLIKAAVAVQVLSWLAECPQIPETGRADYARQLITWSDRFRNRAREHMRRIAKAQNIWEAGELN